MYQIIKKLYLTPEEMRLLKGIVVLSSRINSGPDKISLREFENNSIDMPLERARALRRMVEIGWSRRADDAKKYTLGVIADKILYE